MGSKRGNSSGPSGGRKQPVPRSRTSARPARSAAPAKARPAKTASHFPVVGIGASAGGLQAVRRFFNGIPADPGIAFVVVQHLDPDRKSETAELLRKDRRLPVVQVSDKQPVERDRVYVIPPNCDLAIRRGVLHLAEPAVRRGFRTPIDGFLRSLAEDQGEWGVAVILSGTGADGALGVRAVKAAGGLTMAQDPDTAEYDGMPRSAVDTGQVDFALPVQELPGPLLRYVRHPYLQRREGGASLTDRAGAGQFQAILALLKARTKYDFGSYKSGTISRRIERRMSLKHLHSVPDYVKYLQEHPVEVNELFRDLLISVTNFFREPRAWECLRREVIPRLVEARAAEGVIRAWVPGCATGEEAYSLAMLMIQQLQATKKPVAVQLFASDLDAAALEFARAGVYPESIAADVPPELLRRFFTKTDHSLRVSKEVREVVVFALQNLISDPPFSKIDLISCRNLMIYLAPEIHRRVISLFHFALRPDGYLFLGNAESIGAQTDLFEPISKKWRIYRRIGQVRHNRLEFPVIPGLAETPRKEAPAPPPTRESRSLAVAQSVILERYVPAAALVSGKQEILYLFGNTQRFLVQPSGQLTPDVLEWSRGSVRSKLRAALRQAMQEKRLATARAYNVADGESRTVRITVDPLVVPKEVEGCFLVVFEDEPSQAGVATGIPSPSEADETAVRQLELEVNVLREQLRTGAEQFESSAEELKSANEEMMSMNEELQSANEELETSKEELQSLNEELGTVNAELETKVQELEATTDDLQNLLSSTHIATIFLDRQFRIRRFTPAMTDLLNLLPSDLRRPIGDFAQKFTDQRLISDGELVLRDLQPREAEVRTDAGHWYLRRILPYRTEDDRIDGVVVTFVDITQRRAAEQDRARVAAIVESAEVAIIGKTLDGTITTWNRGAETMQGYSADEAIGRSIDFIVPPEQRDQMRGAVSRVARGEIVELESVWLHREGRRLHVLLSVSPVYDPTTGELIGASSIGRDITARREAEEEVRRTKEALEAQVVAQTRDLREANERLVREVEERRRSDEVRKLLLQRVVTIENDERRRISRELHDQIGQLVAALTLRLKALEPTLPNEGLKVVQQMVDELGRQVHDLAIEVRPTALDELGLLPSVSNFAEEWAQRHQIELDYHARGFDQTRLAPAIEETVFRIVLESLTNVGKHAKANRVSLILERRDAEIRAIIEDDGVGFDPEELKSADGRRRLGLVGMEERAAMVDGTLTTESRRGGGTTVFVRIPLAVQE